MDHLGMKAVWEEGILQALDSRGLEPGLTKLCLEEKWRLKVVKEDVTSSRESCICLL